MIFDPNVTLTLPLELYFFMWLSSRWLGTIVASFISVVHMLLKILYKKGILKSKRAITLLLTNGVRHNLTKIILLSIQTPISRFNEICPSRCGSGHTRALVFKSIRAITPLFANRLRRYLTCMILLSKFQWNKKLRLWPRIIPLVKYVITNLKHAMNWLFHPISCFECHHW